MLPPNTPKINCFKATLPKDADPFASKPKDAEVNMAIPIAIKIIVTVKKKLSGFRVMRLCVYGFNFKYIELFIKFRVMGYKTIQSKQ